MSRLLWSLFSKAFWGTDTSRKQYSFYYWLVCCEPVMQQKWYAWRTRVWVCVHVPTNVLNYGLLSGKCFLVCFLMHEMENASHKIKTTVRLHSVSLTHLVVFLCKWKTETKVKKTDKGWCIYIYMLYKYTCSTFVMKVTLSCITINHWTDMECLLLEDDGSHILAVPGILSSGLLCASWTRP